MVLALTLNLGIFLSALLGVVGLLALSALLYRHPSRPCPNCGEAVRITSRTCPRCRYQLVWFRFSR